MKRREFLGAALGLAAGGISACGSNRSHLPLPPGELAGAGFARGHRLNHALNIPPVSETRQAPVLIVGAGIAGLSAGWKLQRAGLRDFLITELEDQVGGNSRYGENTVSRYPLGAHYLPLPGSEARAVRELLADLGVLQGDPLAAAPNYDERYLCATPQERLFLRGSWHEGLMPAANAGSGELQKIERFQQIIETLRKRRDRRGRRAFAIPMEYSSRTPDLLALDRITLAQWLRQEGLDCPALRWYLNYTSRDDFGAGIDAVSAWAGLHYFACRDGAAANAAGDTVLTAPEGNGWIVRGLEERLRPHLLSGAMATALRESSRNGRTAVEVDYFLPRENRSLRIVAEQVIWAGPLFVLNHVWRTAPDSIRRAAGAFDYAPWMVANLTLSEAPHTRAGAPLAWDNVLHAGPGLGYVVATHQQMRVRPGPTVITYYHAFDQGSARATRQKMLAEPRATWAAEILRELGKPHPELPEITQRLDVFLHGHAMIKPLPGVIWGAARQQLSQLNHPRLRLAHTDLSGMSLFEEANYRGVLAAEQTLQALGLRHASSLQV